MHHLRRDVSVKDSDGSRTFRALFISDVHLGTQRVPGRARCSTSCANTMPKRSTWSATSSTAGRSRPAGTGRSSTTTWCRSCCARRARARASSTCRAITTRCCATSTARISAASRWSRTRCMRAPTGGATSSPMATSSISWCRMRAGSRCSATRPTTSRSTSTASSTPSAAASASPTGRCRKWAKLKVKNAVNYIGDFEKTLAAEAQRFHADGVICGHIHHAAIHD